MDKTPSRWTKRRRVRAELAENLNVLQYDEMPSSSMHNDSVVSNDGVSPLDISTDELALQCDSGSNFEDQGQLIVSDSEFEQPSDSDVFISEHSSGSASDVTSSDMDSIPDLRSELACWAVECNVPQNTTSKLLSVLRKYHPDLPKDPRSLLNTKVNYLVKHVSNGKYHHFGLKAGITSVIEECPVMLENEVKVQVNVDGLPLFKSSGSQFWPILGMIDNAHYRKPFLIGIYFGTTKPKNLAFLTDFVEEAKDLLRHGCDINGRRLIVNFHAFICDAPARAFIKNIKGHSGYSGCDRCVQHGTYLNKVVFLEIDACPRTDASFRGYVDEDHHLGETVLTSLNIDMVKNFPHDYMHLVCLGVTRKLIKLWVQGPLHARQGSNTIKIISDRLISFKPSVPCDFARKPRSLFEFKRWKATELRQFLLYTGPLALRHALPDSLYHNFMLLSVAMYIFLSPAMHTLHYDIAKELLHLFVKHFGESYGNDMISYNVHGLTHLHEDVATYGALDNVSGFPFENFLGRLKRLVKKPVSPLEQIIRRASEGVFRPKFDAVELLQKEHKQGPLPEFAANAKQYKELHLPAFVVKISAGDNCVKTAGEIILVRNIFAVGDETFVMYQKFCESTSSFMYPVDSDIVGIRRVSNLSQDHEFARTDSILQKCVLLPSSSQYFVVVPLLHCGA